MNKSQLSGRNDMQENSQQGNLGVWSSWRQLPRVSLSGRQDWQRARGGRTGWRPNSSWAGQQKQHEPRASPEQRGSFWEWSSSKMRQSTDSLSSVAVRDPVVPVCLQVCGLNLEKFPLFYFRNTGILYPTSQFIWICFTIKRSLFCLV